jgi:hypothetical protein
MGSFRGLLLDKMDWMASFRGYIRLWCLYLSRKAAIFLLDWNVFNRLGEHGLKWICSTYDRGQVLSDGTLKK